MITGYFAAYKGTEFACVVLHTEEGPVLLLVSDAPFDGFAARGGRYTLEVTPDLCDAFGLRREWATYGHHQVLVLSDGPSGVLIEYDGPNDPGDDRARMIERGVWQQTVASSELRNRAPVSTLLQL